MEQATSKISRIFSGETHFYTRYNPASSMEGESSHVEMKNSSDMDEEEGVEHEEHHGQASYAQRPRRSHKRVLFITLSVLLLFLIGYLLGYVTNRKPPACEPEASDEPRESPSVRTEASVVEQIADWSDIRNMLVQRLSTDGLDKRLGELSSKSHEAGSDGDDSLANLVMDQFTKLDMEPWEDEHYVKLQIPSVEKPNRVLCGEEVIGQPQGYLAYSKAGSVQGKLVYGHFGQQKDFEELKASVSLNGSVLLLRSGKTSFAEKVALAAKYGASAVLIYLDPYDDGNNCGDNCELYGHVHLGCGDPYTPGFPSFNHTQFPPAQSSGLPEILAQTITPAMAVKLFLRIGGPSTPVSWTESRLSGVGTLKLGGETDVKVEVNNVLVEKKIHNVFGIIKGFVDPDRYVVIGAQRDSWGPGYSKSTVGSAILLELAAAITDMVKHDKNAFRPMRSIVFASWSAGQYGSVGATEWLEGYLASLSMKAFTYISLDGVVSGSQALRASASPLLYQLVQETLTEVKVPFGADSEATTLYQKFAGNDWTSKILVPMSMDDGAYPFLAFSGIPSVSFRFTGASQDRDSYQFGQMLNDDRTNLDHATEQNTAEVALAGARIAGHIALRLVHDRLLRLRPEGYVRMLSSHVTRIVRRINALKQEKLIPETLSVRWLTSAKGSYNRATQALLLDINNSDLTDRGMCRIINDRIMRVEHNLLSPYVSVRDEAFRHVLLGRGDFTLQALADHLDNIGKQATDADVQLMQTQLALVTWTIQGCANALAGDVWEAFTRI